MSEFLSIPNIDVYCVLGILSFFTLLEVVHGHYSNTQRRKDDWILEMVGFFVAAVSKTIQIVIIVFLGDKLLPQYSNSLMEWSLLASFLFYILIDDFLQYWYHRSAHEYGWLWKHHLSHHAAREMGVFVSYRNTLVYYLLMPNLWWGALCTYLGLAPAVILGLIFKQVIVTSTHATWKWDEYLYKHSWLSPLAFTIERILITPSFHHGHHGVSSLDNISDPNGNFGNTFSLWDQMFGTANFTRKFPETYGLITDAKDPWYALLLYPFFKSPIKDSEMSKNFVKEKSQVKAPYKAELESGDYLYCQCGYSTNQPFCNGYHHGTKVKPLKFTIDKPSRVSLCTCKKTKTPPYCDGSHQNT